MDIRKIPVTRRAVKASYKEPERPNLTRSNSSVVSKLATRIDNVRRKNPANIGFFFLTKGQT